MRAAIRGVNYTTLKLQKALADHLLPSPPAVQSSSHRLEAVRTLETVGNLQGDLLIGTDILRPPPTNHYSPSEE